MHALAQKAGRLATGMTLNFCDSAPIPKTLLQTGNYFQIPSGKHPSFSHELLNLSLDEDVDFLLPLRKDELLPLSETKTLYREYGIEILLPDVEALKEMNLISEVDRKLVPELLLNGYTIDKKREYAALHHVSGLCLIADSIEDALLCCI